MAQEGQTPTSMMDFADKYGYFPATVESVESHHEGLKLVTTSDDPDADIISFPDDRPPVRFGEYKAEA